MPENSQRGQVVPVFQQAMTLTIPIHVVFSISKWALLKKLLPITA